MEWQRCGYISYVKKVGRNPVIRYDVIGVKWDMPKNALWGKITLWEARRGSGQRSPGRVKLGEFRTADLAQKACRRDVEELLAKHEAYKASRRKKKMTEEEIVRRLRDIERELGTESLTHDGEVALHGIGIKLDSLLREKKKLVKLLEGLHNAEESDGEVGIA
jgi:hypothetical protein